MKLHSVKDKENVKEVLKQGSKSDFWDLICQALDADLKAIEADMDSDEFAELPADQYKLEVEIIKAKKKFIASLKLLPKTIIEELSDAPTGADEGENDDPDPYEK